MYIPFLAKQKTNAWQLAVLPCVFGILFYCAMEYALWSGQFAWRVICAALLGIAAALLAFVLTGGLRACAIGMCGYMAYLMFYFTPGNLIMVITATLSACALVLLIRLLLPKKLLTPDAKANFKSFFWIAGVGIFLFVCSASLLLLLRK